MNKTRSAFIIFFLIISLRQAVAQVPFTGNEMASDFKIGMEMFAMEKFPAAIVHLDEFVRSGDRTNTVAIAEAEYHSALAAINLFNPDAEYRMITFIRSHPESPRINEGRLALGNYFYQNKNYRKTITYLELVNRQELTPEQLPEYFFRLGHSHYLAGDKSRALLMFSEIKDIDTEFTPPSIYYFSQIAYEQKMYQTAMEGFNRLKNDETFGSVVPFYIVQMLYLQKDYDGILEIAPDLLNSAGKDRAVELYRFIGDAYYNKGNYKEALPYLEKFATGTKISGREDKYQLGYCYYRTGELEKAIKIFLEIGAKDDILSQNIWFLLGDSYMQIGNKKRAEFGFAEAAKLNFDKKIREDALFNYAKLLYETSYSPFGEVITSFQEYIDNYPGSDRIEEAYNYLIAAYMQIKNYKAALTSLERLRSTDARLEEAYQRVAFYRGLELFKNLELQASVDMFDKSLKYQKYNRTLRSRAVYWRGEANYRLGRYENARADYIEFMGIPGSMQLSEYNMVRYNLGYALFNLKDYTNAMTHFKTFDAGVANVRPEVQADAKNRIADCYYITTNYPQAISYYDQVIGFGKVDADYAMFQKGFVLGLMNNERGKAEALSSLTLKFPTSTFVPNAIFERGRAYMVLEETSRGEADFNTIISAYPASPLVPKAIVQLGLLYYKLGENQKAIAQFKKVIENFKSTPEARDALTGLKNTYVEANDVSAYFAYIKTLQGYGDVNLAEKDSMVYTSGENLYISGNYDRAGEVLKSYLDEFPNGSFRQNAQFYLAESLKREGNTDEALKHYVAVAGSPNNQFTEQSLITASGIYYDKEDFKSSLAYYEMLEKAASNSESRVTALRGQLRSSNQLGDAQKSIAAAEKILISASIPEELSREALFTKAKANYSLNNFDGALDDFRKVATEVVSSEGAESKYRVAEILFKKELIAESEKIINEFITQNTPHQFWMARMFLLLADISIRKGDTLQARATLQSLKDYYSIDNDGILDEVKSRLDTLNQVK